MQNRKTILFEKRGFLYLFGLYSSKSEIEQFRVSHIRTNTSTSSLVMVLLIYPFNWERCISARWQNLFLLSPVSFSSFPKWISMEPLFSNNSTSLYIFLLYTFQIENFSYNILWIISYNYLVIKRRIFYE